MNVEISVEVHILGTGIRRAFRWRVQKGTSNCRVRLCRIQSHSNVKGKESTDKLVKLGLEDINLDRVESAKSSI